MARLPEGTITFMLTDLQESTRAWEIHPKAMRAAMARHDEILAGTVLGHSGVLVEAGREGDSVLAVFKTAADGAACALEIQKTFANVSWPEGLDLKVRVALHTGEAQLREGHYFGPVLNRCARVLAVCHPGQILVTKVTESLLADEVPPDAELEDLGLHRLKDLTRPEHVFQLADLTRPNKFPPTAPLPQQQTNLPHYLSTFVGRDAELSAVQSLVAKSRMVTLTGAGGSGKTRLAARLGQVCLDLWPGGVWWVELAAVNDSREVPGAVVTALELPGRGPALDVLIGWLTTRRAMLVLDNCEHLVAACAQFCETLLQRCPELVVVATSREPLGVSGEARWPVSAMREVEAVHLFEERARLVVPDFSVTASNVDTVTRICARLDGIPLAIELAAARLGMMTEQELLRQLSDRFKLLTSGSRTAPERHQTMIATLDWSYRLLSEGEAQLFRRLSVFRGGFTLESAHAIWGSEMPGRVLDLVSGLVEKSMVVAERAEGMASRYRLLESQLAYAEDRLIEAGELDVVRRRHYDYFQDSLVAKMNPDPGRPPSGVAESRWLSGELGNLWAAMDWATDNADDRGLTLASELSTISFGDKDRLRPLLAELIDRSPERRLLPRLKALRSASQLAIWQGDYEGGARSADASLALARELGDAMELAHSLISAGIAHSYHEPDAANELYQELISYLKNPKSRSIAAATRTSLMGTVRNNLGWMALIRGDYTTARASLVASVSTARAEENAWDICGYLDSLAWAHWGLNDNQMAAACFKEALAVARDLIAKPMIVGCLEGLSCVADATGKDQRALKLAGAVHRLSEEWSVRSEPWVEMQTERSQHLSRARLGTRKSEDAWKQGWAMTGDEAIDYALGESETGTQLDMSPLSSREREVATLVANGLTNRQIAERLFIAERSAEGHVERIRNKLGVRSRTEVATWAVERGLIPTPLDVKKTRRKPLST